MTALSRDDLVRGLERFGARYEALDVLARDLADDAPCVFERGGRHYRLRIHASGFARLARTAAGTPPGPPCTVPTATVLDRARPPAVLGFLVGEPLGDDQDAPRRVFVMAFDPHERAWHAYDGPLARLVREQRRAADAALRAEP